MQSNIVSSKSPNTRIAYIDVAKSICIFLMIVGHWTEKEFLLAYIYSFHMPALFTISGFLYKPRLWYKTIISLGVPVIFYSFINLAILLMTGQILIEDVMTKATVFRFFHYRYGMDTGTLFCGDWFIWTLLALRFFYGDFIVNIGHFFRRYYIIIATIMVVYVSLEMYYLKTDNIFHGWLIWKMVPCMPFFCFGFYIKEKGLDLSKLSLNFIVSLMLLSIAIPIINGRCGILETQYGSSYILFSFNAMLATLLLLSLSTLIPGFRFFTIISKGTLFILGLHMPIMDLLDYICPDYMAFFIPIIVLLICYYPIALLDRWCPILLGKLK